MKTSVFVLTCCLAVSPLMVVRADTQDKPHQAPVANKIHRETCGACHMVYVPGLLPSLSWEKILMNMKAHHGENVALDANTQTAILDYLKRNAADKSGSGLSRKIMKSLNGAIPDRITEVPLINRKHHELADSLFIRKEIGSRSNCLACHKKADQGDFNEDAVRIPGGNVRERDDD